MFISKRRRKNYFHQTKKELLPLGCAPSLRKKIVTSYLFFWDEEIRQNLQLQPHMGKVASTRWAEIGVSAYALKNNSLQTIVF